MVTERKERTFFHSFKILAEEGYLKVAGIPSGRRADGDEAVAEPGELRIQTGLS